MLSTDTQSFIENWSKEIKITEDGGINEAIQVFGYLYKIYGRLNFEAANVLIQNGTLNSTGGDRKTATENVILYLTADAIINGFNDNNNEPDIASLIKILPSFHIKFAADGKTHEPIVDAQLLTDIQSANNEIKALAILHVIYFVRCNIEHSRKNMEEYQTLLVEPLNNLLKTLNKLLFIELSK